MIGWVYMHSACGKPAFYFRKRPRPFDQVSSRDAVQTSGKPMMPVSAITCGACGQSIRPHTSAVMPVGFAEFFAINWRALLRRIGL